MNALCIVVDGLRSGYLGCYGNSWVQAPAIDRLAARSFVFDQALIDSPRLEDAYRAFWLGRHVFQPRDSDEQALSLPRQLSSASVTSALITDEPALCSHPLAQALEEIVQVPTAKHCTASQSDETQFAAMLTAAADWISAARQPYCVWLHLQGMSAAWDAPIALREQFAEGEDVPQATVVDPPEFWLSADHDPDELLALRWAYAAQVSLLDRCLEAFLEWFDNQEAAQETLLILAGSRGYPLGEHGRVGLCRPVSQASISSSREACSSSTLHEELLHVPLLIRIPGTDGADRSSALVQPPDLAATLAQWFQLAAGSPSLLSLVRGEATVLRDRAGMQAAESSERAIRTEAWHLIQPYAGASCKLFAKPDDRWELNEVSDRCREEAEQLQALLETTLLA